jgi:transposase
MKPWNFKRPSKEDLLKLYNDEKLSTLEIAEIYNVDRCTVTKWLKFYQISRNPLRRPRKWKEKIQMKIKELWRNPEYRRKEVETHRRPELVEKAIANFKYRPTSLERKLMEIIEKYNLPYIYTGDGSFRIGKLNPDFVNNNGEKIAVDVFGDYWHGRRENVPWHERENVRRLIMKRYGWDLRVIWEHELNNLPEEEIVRRLMQIE